MTVQKNLLDPIVTERKDGNTYMYLFAALYQDMVTGKNRDTAIEINEQNFTDEREVYLAAMNLGYRGIKQNEFLASLEFISC